MGHTFDLVATPARRTVVPFEEMVPLGGGLARQSDVCG
jgi:hypothetical protein